jgi:hypothetical protein
MNKSYAAFALGLLLLLGAIVIGIFLAWPIQWLWNNTLVGAADGINPIGFGQAYGIYILSTLLFRSNVTSSSKKDK